MPNPNLIPALMRALRFHEIGSKSPYQLSFAKKGKSGASFGAMQGDLAARQPKVTQTFHDVLEAAGFPTGTVNALMATLSGPLRDDPLSDAEESRINAALEAHRDLVDAMDQGIAAGIFDNLDLCVASAASANRTITPRAQLYIAMWINMTGAPDRLRTWLKGGPVNVPMPGPVVDVPDIERYLRASKYYIENPDNFPHMQQSAAEGAKALP